MQKSIDAKTMFFEIMKLIINWSEELNKIEKLATIFEFVLEIFVNLNERFIVKFNELNDIALRMFDSNSINFKAFHKLLRFLENDDKQRLKNIIQIRNILSHDNKRLFKVSIDSINFVNGLIFGLKNINFEGSFRKIYPSIEKRRYCIRTKLQRKIFFIVDEIDYRKLFSKLYKARSSEELIEVENYYLALFKNGAISTYVERMTQLNVLENFYSELNKN